jgi:hypothetical protein
LAKGVEVRADDWKGDDELKKLGYSLEPLLVLDGDPEITDSNLPMIYIAI